MNNDANTILLTIPVQLRKKYDLDQPTNVLMIPTDDGILIKRLEMETMK
jgi:bifunctional DNA-binding transcriptional regulator/antitoxin component of YhaV-PrlF toxin-antitoxin module